jgi:hypothetical protein
MCYSFITPTIEEELWLTRRSVRIRVVPVHRNLAASIAVLPVKVLATRLSLTATVGMMSAAAIFNQ